MSSNLLSTELNYIKLDQPYGSLKKLKGFFNKPVFRLNLILVFDCNSSKFQIFGSA